MQSEPLLLTVTLAQQVFFCASWLLAAYLRLARRPALHWAVATAWAGLPLGLLLLPHLPSARWAAVLVNLCWVASFVALRRGIQAFGHLAHSDREHVVVMLLGLLVAAAVAQWGSSKLPLVFGTSLLMAWTLWRCAAEIRSSMQAEFGARVALWFALPTGAVAALMVLRAVAGWLPGAMPAPIEVQAPVHIGMLFASMALGVMINAGLLAMVVGRLVRRLQFQSEHDALTGLLGRRPMDKLLHAEALRQARSGQPYALLSLDIDHFKQINDRCGHAAGDAMLVCVAKALRRVAREVDSVARMGGEEFFVLLPGTDRAGAEQAAHRMLDAVRQIQCPQTGCALTVTISIGVAVASASGEPVQDLLRRVDHALYAAKLGGRDRMECAPPPASALA